MLFCYKKSNLVLEARVRWGEGDAWRRQTPPTRRYVASCPPARRQRGFRTTIPYSAYLNPLAMSSSKSHHHHRTHITPLKLRILSLFLIYGRFPNGFTYKSTARHRFRCYNGTFYTIILDVIWWWWSCWWCG